MNNRLYWELYQLNIEQRFLTAKATEKLSRPLFAWFAVIRNI